MNAEGGFEARLAHARQRLDGLAGEVASLPSKQKTLLKELLEELSAGIAELGTAVAELRDRKEALVSARREADEQRWRYEELFTNAPDAYVTTGPDATIREVNTAAAALLGHSPDTLARKALVAFVSGNDRRALTAAMGAAAQGAGIQRAELAIKCGHGGKSFCQVSVAPVKARGGELLGFRWILRDTSALREARAQIERTHAELEERAATLTATVEDLQKEISERRWAQEALRESEERFNLFMKHLPGAAYVKDADGRILFINDHVGKLLGVDPESLVGKTDWDLWPREIAAKMREDEEWVLSTGKVRETIDVFVTPSGPVHYLTYKFPLPQQHSRPLVAGVSVDITERIRMEEALRESEERYRCLVELSPDAIVVAVNGKVVFANAACAHVLAAARPEDLYGAQVRDFIHPDMRQLARRRLDQVLQNRRRMPMTELRLVRADGVTVDVEAASTPISYVEQPAVQFVFHDITQRKQAEARIHEYREQLRSLASEVTLSEERERRRIAQILHDNISQVLAVSKMMLAEAMQAGPRAERDRRVREVSGLLDDSIKYARTLTLDLSNPTLYVLGLEAALDGLVRKVGETHKIAVSFRDDGAAKPLSEDLRVLLYQCTRELLMNIVKHAHAGNIAVSTRRDGASLRVSVEDDGVGFNVPEMWERLTRGGGIGLFSIRERLGHFGGRLDVKSQPGTGAVVTMIAPLDLKTPDARERLNG